MTPLRRRPRPNVVAFASIFVPAYRGLHLTTFCTSLTLRPYRRFSSAPNPAATCVQPSYSDQQTSTNTSANLSEPDTSITSDTTTTSTTTAVHTSDASEWKGLEHEIEQARREGRPYRLRRDLLTPQERHLLRLRSRAIPLVADPPDLDIIHEDDSLLVVNKPTCVKMHPAHRFQGGSLLNRAIGHLGYAPHIVHRLDMHTTGVVVLAKRKSACHSLMHQFAAAAAVGNDKKSKAQQNADSRTPGEKKQQRQSFSASLPIPAADVNGDDDNNSQSPISKRYLCVVDNVPYHPCGARFTVNVPIQRARNVQFIRLLGDISHPDAKYAVTDFTVLAKSAQHRMALLLAAPRTGRTHQIRVHAAFRGHPIVGDDLYNPTERNMYADFDEISAAARDPSLQRYGDDNPLRRDLMLHAWQLSLLHPDTGERVTYCAPPPPHMRGLLAATQMSVPP